MTKFEINLIAAKFAAARHDTLRFGDDCSKTEFMVAGIEKATRYVSDAFAGLDPKFDRDEFMEKTKAWPVLIKSSR